MDMIKVIVPLAIIIGYAVVGHFYYQYKERQTNSK